MKERTHRACLDNIRRPRNYILAIIGLHYSIDKKKHLNPLNVSARIVTCDCEIVSIIVTGCDNRTIVSTRIYNTHFWKSRGVRANPNVTGL
jgi:hypothetical protein